MANSFLEISELFKCSDAKKKLSDIKKKKKKPVWIPLGLLWAADECWLIALACLMSYII